MGERTGPPIRLSPKEEGFCIAVVAGRNPSDAYRIAYQPKRAQAKTIHEMASRLMAKRKIRTRLTDLIQPLVERARLTREEWLERLARICLADVRIWWPGSKNGVSEAGGRMLRVRMVDQLKALELYGKAMGVLWRSTENGCL